MKKVISFLLALGMVISMIPTNVFAVESTEVSLTGKTISILGDSISTFKYNGFKKKFCSKNAVCCLT